MILHKKGAGADSVIPFSGGFNQLLLILQSGNYYTLFVVDSDKTIQCANMAYNATYNITLYEDDYIKIYTVYSGSSGIPAYIHSDIKQACKKYTDTADAAVIDVPANTTYTGYGTSNGVYIW